MSYILRLGYRNVFRQRLRSALAILGVALSVALVIVGTSMMSGVAQMVFAESLGEAGEVVVAREDYFKKYRFNPLKYSIKDSSDLRRALLRIDGVESAIERIDFGFLAETGEASTGLGCSAIDVEQFARFSTLPDRLVAGRYLRPGEKGILIGRSVADELELAPGDTLTVIGKTLYDSFMADDYEIVGVFDLGTKMLNRRSFLPLAQAQDFLEMPGAVSKILLYGKHYTDADLITERIRSAGLLPQGVILKPWTEDPFFGSIHTLLGVVGLLISGIICFVAGLGIFNMMMVSVLERRKEVGLLMALGARRGGIFASFLYESVLYGLVGGTAGVLLGAPAALYLDRVGIDLRIDDVQGLPFPITSTIHGDFGPESVILGLAIGVLLCLLGTFGPVLKTFSMGPQDAMTR